MLTKDPEDRPTVKELLAHKWFKVCVCVSMIVPRYVSLWPPRPVEAMHLT